MNNMRNNPAAKARIIMQAIELSAPPVGVRFLGPTDEIPFEASPLQKHRYCQALMKARNGETVLLNAEGISCPAAAAAFGFKKLPENPQNGKGLVGFGIVSQQDTGRHMFDNMPYLPPGKYTTLHLFPLDQAKHIPDVVILEDEPEKLMWISLAYLNIRGGERVSSSTAVLQATCIDATIIPFLEQRLNQCFGCYGCRDATDIGPTEAVLGFPGNLLPDLADSVEFLKQEAIPVSRSKRAYAALLASHDS